MQLKLEIPDILLSRKILWVLIVVHIIGLDQESLCFFKEIVHFEIAHKLWVKAVKDAFSASSFHFQRATALFLQLVQN